MNPSNTLQAGESPKADAAPSPITSIHVSPRPTPEPRPLDVEFTTRSLQKTAQKFSSVLEVIINSQENYGLGREGLGRALEHQGPVHERLPLELLMSQLRPELEKNRELQKQREKALKEITELLEILASHEKVTV